MFMFQVRIKIYCGGARTGTGFWGRAWVPPGPPERRSGTPVLADGPPTLPGGTRGPLICGPRTRPGRHAADKARKKAEMVPKPVFGPHRGPPIAPGEPLCIHMPPLPYLRAQGAPYTPPADPPWPACRRKGVEIGSNGTKPGFWAPYWAPMSPRDAPVYAGASHALPGGTGGPLHPA